MEERSIADLLSEGPDLTRYEALYKHFHSHPELSLQESQTASAVALHLESLEGGYEIRSSIGGYGLVGVLRNGSGPIVLLRSEMDGLPVLERTGLSFASKVAIKDLADGVDKPVMHACGHDMHITCLLAAAEHLAHIKSMWSGTLIVLFQPDEERGAGAQAMVNDGLYDKIPLPDVVLGQHLMPLRAGVIGNRKGTIMGAADSFKVTLFGKGSHASMPHRSVDPVVLAANVVLRLQNIVSREIDPGEMAVVTVGSVQAGSTENIIADHAVLKVNIRTTTSLTREKVLKAVRRIVKAECDASGSPKEALVEPTSRFPLTVNDDNIANRLAVSFGEYFKEDFNPDQAPINASEDFSILASSVGKPYNFWFFGGVDHEVWDRAEREDRLLEDIAVNHSAHFAPAIQPTLRAGFEALCVAALTFLERKVLSTLAASHNYAVNMCILAKHAPAQSESCPSRSGSERALPQKRSFDSLTSDRYQDVQAVSLRPTSPTRSVKRIREPSEEQPPDLASPGRESTAKGVPKSFRDISETSKKRLPESRDMMVSVDALTDSSHPRSLRSPIRLSSELGLNGTDSPATQISDIISSSPLKSSSRYVWYPPRNPGDKSIAFYDAHPNRPRRRLSYGESYSKPARRHLHREAAWMADDFGLASCFHEALKGSETGAFWSEPTRSKPSILLGLSEDEKVTLDTSPSKARVVSIGRRHVTVDPSETVTPDCNQQTLSELYFYTPPQTPVSPSSVIGLGIDSIKDVGHESEEAETRASQGYNKPKFHAACNLTPPSSGFSTARSTGTVKRVSAVTAPIIRQGIPGPPCSAKAPHLSELTTWILKELEESVVRNPRVGLHLDSPVILQLRMPESQRKVPRRPAPTLPTSRYYIGPLSSNPPCMVPSFCGAPSPHPLPSFPMDATTRALQTIFPSAKVHIISQLQATIVALHYISTLRFSAAPGAKGFGSPLAPNMSYIPEKARAMLGVPAPISRPTLPTHWFEAERCQERITNLELQLRREAMRLIRLCEADGRKKEEALLRAVGEIARAMEQ